MEFISLMEIIGTVAFAISGALVAINKELDYYGIAFLAIITAVGGGIVRDTIINVDLPVALANPLYVIISIATAALVILLYRFKKLIKYPNMIQFFDAIGLAAFTAIGAEAALKNDVYMAFVVVTLAILTGTGGGILRDVFVKEIPFVFQKEVYAVASIIGAFAFMATYYFFQVEVAMYVCFGVTLAIRLVAVQHNWHLGKVKK